MARIVNPKHEPGAAARAAAWAAAALARTG